jgi:LPS sulfotransferase NodH
MPEATPGSVPDFLYIGAPRTGSTWLYLNLQRHPDVWIPPCKSIIYFHPRFQRYRLKKLKRFWKEALVSGDRDTRAWYRSFFAKLFVDERWYLSLFPQGRITGEIAEAYCSLERYRVQRIHRVMPNVKVIFALRNPVERALSQAKLGLVIRKNRRIDDVSEDEFVAYIDRPGSQARSRYSHTLDIWNAFFPMEQFLILFYDDLVRNPESYLSNICRFIGVQLKTDYIGEMMNARVNKSIDKSLPPAVVKHAARTYRAEVEELAARFGGFARQWQHEVEEILA